MISKKDISARLRKIIYSLPEIKIANPYTFDSVIVTESDINVKQGDYYQKFFFDSKDNKFIIYVNIPEDIGVYDIRYSKKETAILLELLDSFINKRSPNIKDVLRKFKVSNNGNKQRRTIKRAKDNN